MRELRRWHLLLVPVPVFGWLLLAALLADEFELASQLHRGASSRGDAPRAMPVGSIAAAGTDYALAALLWTLLPPAIGWLAGAILLLCRDVGTGRASVGRRLFGTGESGEPGQSGELALRRSFTRSFDRNLPLLVPFLGPLVELVLVATGRRRLGDRLLCLR